MVHGLASQLGGALTIESAPGLGTNIELWLPTCEAGSKGPAAARAAAPESDSRSVGTVLLVDDEELVRMSTADMLADLGYTVTEAASAEEAMGLVDQGLRPDMLVSDHLMAGMNGTDLAHELQARLPKLCVLIISGYAESDAISPDLHRLTKPFRKHELAASLGKCHRRVE
jgi:CheY-like chemotaxis protein